MRNTISIYTILEINFLATSEQIQRKRQNKITNFFHRTKYNKIGIRYENVYINNSKSVNWIRRRKKKFGLKFIYLNENYSDSFSLFALRITKFKYLLNN